MYKPGLYWWVRTVDETGMSGTGIVAQASIFEDNTAVLRWLKTRNAAGVGSFCCYDTVEQLLHVHGHGDKKTGVLIPALEVGNICMINCIEGFGGAATVVAIRDNALSHYRVQMVEEHFSKEPFWAHDFEVSR